MKTWKVFVLTGGATAAIFLLVSWRQKASNLAARFIDTEEIGDNAGFSNAAFQEMMQSVGWQGGEAWCMFFAKAIYQKAFPKKRMDITRILSGSTQTTWKNALANQDIFKVITDGKPQKGDIIIWQDISNPASGHAGIVYKKQSGDVWYTIEGNTSLAQAQSGQGVNKKTRNLAPGAVEGNLKLLGFLRLKTNLF